MSRLDPKVAEENRLAFIGGAAESLKKKQIFQWLKENPDIGATSSGRFYKVVRDEDGFDSEIVYVYPPQEGE
jgi:hypothetical protein